MFRQSLREFVYESENLQAILVNKSFFLFVAFHSPAPADTVEPLFIFAMGGSNWKQKIKSNLFLNQIFWMFNFNFVNRFKI